MKTLIFPLSILICSNIQASSETQTKIQYSVESAGTKPQRREVILNGIDVEDVPTPSLNWNCSIQKKGTPQAPFDLILYMECRIKKEKTKVTDIFLSSSASVLACSKGSKNKAVHMLTDVNSSAQKTEKEWSGFETKEVFISIECP